MGGLAQCHWECRVQSGSVRRQRAGPLSNDHAIFIGGIAIGTRLKLSLASSTREHWPSGWERIFKPRVGAAVLVFLFSIALAKTLIYFEVFQIMPAWGIAIYVALAALIYMAAIVIGLWDWPARHAIIIAISMLVLSIIFQKVGTSPSNGMPTSQWPSDILVEGI